MDNHFENKDGEQNIAQGDHAIGKQVNNYGVPPELFAQYVSELGVTDSALTSFFKILEQEQVPVWELDSKLREIAFRYKESLMDFESVRSGAPEVQCMKEQIRDAIKTGAYEQAEVLLAQLSEYYRQTVALMKTSLVERKAIPNEWQISEAKGCISQAKLQRLQYRYEKSARYYQEAAVVLPEEYKWERAICLGAAGGDLYRITRYTEALCLFKKSLSIYREVGDRRGESKTLNNISQIYQAQGEYSKGLMCLEKSLPICRETGDKELEGAILNNMGQIIRTQYDDSKALLYLEQSLMICREINDKEGEGITLSNIGTIYFRQGAYATALQFFNQVLASSREINDRGMEGTCLNNISQVYHEQNKFDAALDCLKQALVIQQQLGNRQCESVTLNNIAAFYISKEDYPIALRYYGQALAIAEEIGDKSGEASTRWSIGLLYKDQGELIKAEPYLSRAVELGTQLEHPKLAEWRKALETVRTKLREQYK